MDLSRTFNELTRYKELINQRENEIKELEEELNASKEEEKIILEEYKIHDTNKENEISNLELEIIDEKNKKFENKEEKENSKKEIEKNREKIEKIKEDFQTYVKEDFEIKKNNLIEKWNTIKSKIQETIENLENVKEVFEKYYEELMKNPEIKKMYDKAVADRAVEKANELESVNEIYSKVVSEYYKNIELRREKISLEDKEKFEIELKNGIEKKELKELTLEIIADVSQRDKKDLTENEMRLRENLEKEYKDVHIITDDIRDEIFSKNERLIDDIRRETLEEKVKLYEYKKHNQMIDDESKSKKKLYSKEEFEIAKKEEKEAIEFAIKINDKKINDYAEKILQDESFITGVLRYSKMNENSNVKNYLENKETIEKNKRKIIELILNEYGDPKIREKMGKEAKIYKKVANNIYEKIKEKVKIEKEEKVEDEKEIDKEQNKEEDAETKEKVKTFYRDPEINDTLQLTPEQVKELLRQRAENPEELEFQEDEIKAKNGFFSKFKNWFVRTKNKINEKEDIEEIEDEEEQNQKQDEQENEEILEQKEKENLEKKRDEYEKKIRELFREKIERESEELAKREKEKNKEDKEREK